MQRSLDKLTNRKVKKPRVGTHTSARLVILSPSIIRRSLVMIEITDKLFLAEKKETRRSHVNF